MVLRVSVFSTTELLTRGISSSFSAITFSASALTASIVSSALFSISAVAAAISSVLFSASSECNSKPKGENIKVTRINIFNKFFIMTPFSLCFLSIYLFTF